LAQIIKKQTNKQPPAELDLLKKNTQFSFEKWAEPLHALISKCLSFDLSERPSMQTVVNQLSAIFASTFFAVLFCVLCLLCSWLRLFNSLNPLPSFSSSFSSSSLSSFSAHVDTIRLRKLQQECELQKRQLDAYRSLGMSVALITLFSHMSDFPLSSSLASPDHRNRKPLSSKRPTSRQQERH
jgi:hypothetical protein